MTGDHLARCWNCEAETTWRNEHDVAECRDCREALRCPDCDAISACIPPDPTLCAD